MNPERRCGVRPERRKYAKVFDIGLQNTFVYRWNFLLRSLFGLVPLAGTILIWRAIFQERGADVAGYDYRVDGVVLSADDPGG